MGRKTVKDIFRGIEKEKFCLKAHSVNDITALFLFILFIFSGDNEHSFSLLFLQIVSTSVGL